MGWLHESFFFLVTNLNRDKTPEWNSVTSFCKAGCAWVGLRVTPLIKISHTRLAIGPRSQSLITLPDSRHLD